MDKQLLNAQYKLERAQRHAEEKRIASQKTIERLQQEYEEMSLERRDNDKQVEEMRADADEIERKVGFCGFDWAQVCSRSVRWPTIYVQTKRSSMNC